MKNLKTFLAAIAILSAMFISNAQKKVVRVYPTHGTVVTTVTKPKIIVHKKTNFYFADGVWYKAKGRKYVVVGAPVGLKVRKLPRGKKLVVINGRKLYRYKGIWYKKSGRNYVIVNV
ncbi:DUF6515 family protein [Croceitalea sp. P059]|uniref:DUF6515 family protein n=1 Tax=Croceitalea sp. P059 TaxID=3075601 RepID=UPI002887C56C|nr:DUF6515 family protein [Croceitalea sp. P059]MDT0540081.1 DUF6515 family protein [Croceitalea sp. P059]